ncbi:MAG TPA: NAD-dependent epimerase/dehydratase family protein [Methylibium sp.]|uniref:NAD-dependent epimerase/dehydratase family protein n=1 Tax=Methylibium sp. TaxID=2067992 RepID=UPI002DB56F56|nr:NAD-dependent epimerase/dehydratase family protein [Methylibium sp.]HEU4460728.1 NAD-dependent epimerase/dehydratase family protein [Methylibium sp.]
MLLGGGGFIGSNYYAGHGETYEQVTLVDRFDGPSHSSLSEHERLCSKLRHPDRIFTADAAEIGRWPELLAGSTDVFILNADTGTGSSFARPSFTVAENLSKLAAIVEAIRAHGAPERTRVIFTSSRAVYGEGRWHCPAHGTQPADRSREALDAGRFAPMCPHCSVPLQLAGSVEHDAHRPLSVYGLTKSCGEDLLRLTLCAGGFDVRIARFQNVYGIGQAIDNPYTGVLNWFSQALLEGSTVRVFERGLIVRDFIFVSDAVALLHALATTERAPQDIGAPMIMNGGTGRAARLIDVAHMLRNRYGSSSEIIATNDFRTGDVLGAVADTSRAHTCLGLQPRVTLEEGIARYAAWFAERSKGAR